MKIQGENSFHQMFLSIVNVGRYKEMNKSDTTIRIPPFIEGSSNIRYDSVYNKIAKHFIIYDNAKAYPGYLITYKNNRVADL